MIALRPRYLRHFTTNVRVLGIADDAAISSRSNYLVVELLITNALVYPV